jgi:hypothetical protein
VIVVGVGQQHVRDVAGLDPELCQPGDDDATHSERAAVYHQLPVRSLNQHDRAPADAAVKSRLAGIALDDYVDLVFTNLHFACLSGI